MITSFYVVSFRLSASLSVHAEFHAHRISKSRGETRVRLVPRFDCIGQLDLDPPQARVDKPSQCRQRREQAQHDEHQADAMTSPHADQEANAAGWGTAQREQRLKDMLG
jgi:hypothetical protein